MFWCQEAHSKKQRKGRGKCVGQGFTQRGEKVHTLVKKRTNKGEVYHTHSK